MPPFQACVRKNLKNFTEEYEQQTGESFPYVGDRSIIQQLFLEFGIQFDHKLQKYYVKREYNFRSNSKPLFHGTPYKRSRSAPFKDDDEEDVDEIRKVVINAGSSRNNGGNGDRQSRPMRRDPKQYKHGNGNGQYRSKSEYRSPMMVSDDDGSPSSFLEANKNVQQGKPNIYGTIIISDDFLIGITTKLLNFKTDKVDGVLQSGFCVSGLTIAGAKKMIEETVSDDRYKSALIYLGSVDILQNKYLITMMQEFTDFLVVCIKKKIHPVLCTLAPLPNILLNDDRIDILKAFNLFLRTNKFNLPVLDIWSCLVKPNTDDFLEDYYHTSAQKTSGSDKTVVLWSPEGSKRVHNFIMKNIGFALLSKETKVFNY
jgi:hypothetical protein